MPSEPNRFFPQYWNDRYIQQDTGWDIGRVSPPLQAYFEQLPDKDLSILIPGCGNSYEAGWLLEKGFTDVTLIDIAEILVARLREKFQAYLLPSGIAPEVPFPDPSSLPASGAAGTSHLHLIAGDFFHLTGQYDLIIEQTFFCALDPFLRKDYVEKMAGLLRPGGKLAGLLFDRAFTDGPPFGGSEEEYRNLFEKRFFLRTLSPCYNSIKPRAGTELFLIAEKPSALLSPT